jgi:hypothetical protein
MKFIITENRVNEVVLNYLNKKVHPDYTWGPELHQFYQDDVEEYGAYDFYINDIVGYTYFGNYFNNGYLGLLLIQPWLGEQLNSLFGNRWEPIFKEWFESNSGLEVKLMKIGNLEDIY